MAFKIIYKPLNVIITIFYGPQWNNVDKSEVYM